MMKKMTYSLNALILIGVGAWFFGNYFFWNFNYKNRSQLFFDVGVNILYSLIIGVANISFFLFLKRKWKPKLTPILKVFVYVLGSVVTSGLSIFLLRWTTKVLLSNMKFRTFVNTENKWIYIFGITIAFIVSVGAIVFSYYKKKQDKKLDRSRIIATTESAKFESLKNQLDPHFLFNSLNVLASLIHENPVKAEQFTTKLSKIYRYVLEQRDKDLTLVTQEVEFAKSYIELLQMRFEDSLFVKIEIENLEEEFKIVPLSLQLLLENAVKHNTITSSKPLHIHIYIQNGMLVVQNNRNAKESIGNTTKVGLENIQNRYQLISNQKIQINTTNRAFVVSLPLLKQKNMNYSEEDKSEKYLRAKKRAENIKDFYYGLMSYCVIIPFLAFVNYKTTGWHNQWFLYPMFGWGLGIAIHAVTLFVFHPSWDKNRIEKLMNDDKF